VEFLGNALRGLFGGGRNIIVETAEVFRVNAEASDARGSAQQTAALAQLAAEFQRPRSGFFDRLIDGVNRLPRPAMVFGVFGLFALAMADPVGFSMRMQGLALVPDPLWWLMGAVVSFYFGGRYQSASQNFQQSIAETLGNVPQVVANIQDLAALRDAPGDGANGGPPPRGVAPDDPGAAGQSGGGSTAGASASGGGDNPALSAWQASRAAG
jgi:hypothetical protein